MIQIKAHCIIASGNFVKDLTLRANGPPVVMQLFLAKDRPFTVLGNIGNGNITINGNGLNIPWLPLNVTSASI